MGYIDMHCDSLMLGLAKKKDTILEVEDSQLDFAKLKKGGLAKAQMFAAFMAQGDSGAWYGYDYNPDHFDLFKAMRDLLLRSIEADKEHFALLKSFGDLAKNEAAGKISAILTIENSALVNGDMDMLKTLSDMDVKVMSLTWNDPNCFGQNHSSDPELMKQGLTNFGKEAIPVMNDLGIVVDVSHLNDGGFYDVAKYSKKPFVATHSNCRALSPHTRNLTDDMIKTLANKGGVAGLNFCGAFLNEDINLEASRVSRLCDHVEYMMKVGGEDIIALGTDYDGGIFEQEIESCDQMDKLFTALKKRGMSDDLLDKFMYKNVERVLKECIK